MAAIPDAVLRMLPRNAKRITKLGSIDPDIQRKIVRGRLVENTLKGKDGGAVSAYRLGQDKRVNMWPELQTNVLILQAPRADLDKMMAEKD